MITIFLSEKTDTLLNTEMPH